MPIKCKHKINVAQNMKLNLNKNLYSNNDMIFNMNFKRQIIIKHVNSLKLNIF